MKAIYALAPYPVERNYEDLARLMQVASVVCIVNYSDGIRDVGHTIFAESIDGKGVWQVTARGYGYIYAFSKEEFIKQCVEFNLEFIRPGPAA